MASQAISRIRGWAPAPTRLFLDRAFCWQPFCSFFFLTNYSHRRTTLAGWGILAGTVAVFLVERIPAFRRDIFCKLPLIGDRYAAYRVHEEEESVEK